MQKQGFEHHYKKQKAVTTQNVLKSSKSSRIQTD